LKQNQFGDNVLNLLFINFDSIELQHTIPVREKI